MSYDFPTDQTLAGKLQQICEWPCLSNDPDDVQVLRVVFDIYSINADRNELIDRCQQASYEVVVGEALEIASRNHQRLGLALEISNILCAIDWLRLDPLTGHEQSSKLQFASAALQEQDAKARQHRNQNRWVKIKFDEKDLPKVAVDFRQLFTGIGHFDDFDQYEIDNSNYDIPTYGYISISEAARQLTAQKIRNNNNNWNYQSLRRKLRSWENASFYKKLITHTDGGHKRVHFTYLVKLLLWN